MPPGYDSIFIKSIPTQKELNIILYSWELKRILMITLKALLGKGIQFIIFTSVSNHCHEHLENWKSQCLSLK